MAALSAFLLCREVGRQMMTRRNGSIIITGATASTRGASGHVAFSSAMVSYTGCLNKDAQVLHCSSRLLVHFYLDTLKNLK